VSHRTAALLAAGRDDWRHHRVPAGLGQHERAASSGTALSGRLGRYGVMAMARGRPHDLMARSVVLVAVLIGVTVRER